MSGDAMRRPHVLEAIPGKVAARLRIGRAWTVEQDDGLGFVAGRLGAWLAVRETTAGSVLRVEVRLARDVADAEPLWAFVWERQKAETLLGCWVHDPDTGVLSLVAELPVVDGDLSVPMLARCVAELVYEAEAMASLWVPERELCAVTALTVIDGLLRDRPHRIATHLRTARSGLKAAEAVLAEVRALRLQSDGHCSIELERHARLGWGLRLVASPGDFVWRAKADGGWESVAAGAGFLTRLNRLDAQAAEFSPGRWDFGQDDITYRVFLSAAVLEVGACAAAMVTTLAQAVAARAFPLTSTGSGRLLAATSWPGDDTVPSDAHSVDPADIPDHPNRLTAYELFRDRPARPVDKPGSLAGTVVLVDVGGDDDERLYVIPDSWARNELRSYATLRFARSYRDVLADDGAVQTVVDALGPFLEDLDEDLDEDLNERELFAKRVAEDAPFDAEAVFGSEGWRQWYPSADESSAQFAEDRAPVLWSRFSRLDGGWGIDYDPTDYLAAEDEEQILAELRVLGCDILQCPGLARLYLDPDPDLVARIDAGEWPPKSRESAAAADPHDGTRVGLGFF